MEGKGAFETEYFVISNEIVRLAEKSKVIVEFIDPIVDY